MRRDLLDALCAAQEARRPAALVLALPNDATAAPSDTAQAVVTSDAVLGTLALDAAEVAAIRDRLHLVDSGPLAGDGGRTLFVRVYAPPRRMIIVGAVHIAQVLAPMAQLSGYGVTVIDPREAYATSTRFPGVPLVVDWPDDAIPALAPDSQTAVITLSHDIKIDDPALIAALDTDAGYIGALGSRVSHGKRRERLAEAGIDDAAFARIRAPVGLKLGGRGPAEIAVSILAQLVQIRHSPGEA